MRNMTIEQINSNIEKRQSMITAVKEQKQRGSTEMLGWTNERTRERTQTEQELLQRFAKRGYK